MCRWIPQEYARMRAIARELWPLADHLEGFWGVESGAAGPFVIMSPVDSRESVVQVLRCEQSVDLTVARRLVDDVRAGRHVGTLAEPELLARRLRDAGVAAQAL